jgi:8-oxo-dGTP pyrophosphatase MutT (NUDIX family)
MARDIARGHPAPSSTTSRVREGAKALIVVSGRCLLVKEHHADGRPFWTLPGGGLESGESPIAGLRREVLEELCCRVTVGDRVGQFWYTHTRPDVALSQYTVYCCRPRARPTVNHREGVLDYRWARPSDLPPSTVPQVRCLLCASATA